MLKKAEPNRPVPHGFLNSVIPSSISANHSLMCNKAQSATAAAVIMVQRRALALSPALAASMAKSMVRLLVTRIKVMIATLVMLWNGLGQLGVALRRKP